MTSNRFELIIYIPTFNRHEKLKNCLDIISREIVGLEDKVLVYISNNGSPDGTKKYLQSLDYKWLHIRHNKENVGGALNILHCFDLPIKSEFVWLIGDDDYLMPNSISDIISLIKKFPAAEYIFCNTKAFENQKTDEILKSYFKTGSVDGGVLKSHKYIGTALVDFEKLIDPDIADTLLGELMVHCFRQSTVRFDSHEFENFDFNTIPWETMDLKTAGKLFQPQNLPFLKCYNGKTKAVYCDIPRTFNFWGSAEWLGDYDYIFPIIILFLISQYKERGFISNNKFLKLLDYYYSIMRGSLYRQICGQSTARPFNQTLKAKMFEILFVYMNKHFESICEINQKAHGSDSISTKPTPDIPVTSIIILTHNQLNYTKKCIDSIFTHTQKPFELIVVDNGSTDGTVEYLESEVGGQGEGIDDSLIGGFDDWGRDGGQGKRADDSLIGRLDDWGKQGGRKGEVRIIKNKENLGFAAGNNQGMAAARGDYILLMNNDIVVTPNWLERMVSCSERDPKIGIVGPMSNYVSGPQLVENVTYDIQTLNGLEDFATKFSDQHGGQSQHFLRVVGFCMLIKRAVIDRIGGMDAGYGLGNFEDDDFSLRATLAGFESWIAKDCFIHHFGSRTFIGAKIDYRESLSRNWEIFKKKWGFPKEMPYGSYNATEILKKGFIPEKHYYPLSGKPASTIQKATGQVEDDAPIQPQVVFKKKMEPGMVTIIIPVSRTSKYLKKCVFSINAHTPMPHEILFVDNGCKAGTLKWIRQAVKGKSNYRLIKAGKNSLLSKSYNMGMEASSGEYIIFLRDHVIVADGWLDGMLKCINRAEDVGIVGPMTNAKSVGVQCVADSGHVGIDQLEKYAGAFSERNRHRRVPSREVAGFCLLFRRSLVQQIGLFDEELEEGCESEDYCVRAALEGYKNLIAGDVFILCGDLPPKGNKRSFDHKWNVVDTKGHDGERLRILNAVTDAEKLYQREEIDKAIVTIIDGIGYGPDEEAIYHRLAEMLIGCERFKEGLDAINSMPKDKEDSARTLELTGYCKAGLELYDEAAQFADRALSLNASSASALNLMGVLAHGRGDKSASEDFFKRAIASDPGYGEAYTNLGILQWEAGRKESALEILEKSFILSPTAEDGRTAYLSAISETTEFERAEGVFREAKALYPENRRIAFLLIDILIRQEKYESAIQDIREAMITFGINDGILSAAQAVLDKFDVQVTKDAGKKPVLSLCMIVKDEEDCLARCLLSVIPVVDEIIIVDTGSTDRTKAIAKTFGAKVYDFEWIDDFSEARNLSLSKATGDWILVLDADETISPLDYGRLTKIVKSNTDHPSAYSIITRNYTRAIHVIGWMCNDGQYAEEEEGTGWYPSPKVRLFTNDNRIRFENPVHELVEHSLKRCGIKIRKCDIPVHHYGQLDRDHYDAKSEAYYLLGKKKLEEEGEDLKTLIELAVQAEGKLGKYEEAVDMWQRVLKIDPGNEKALLNMGCTYFKLEKYEPARTSSKMVMELDPSLKEAVIIYTTCEMLIGDVEKAIPILENLLKKVPEYPLAIAILAAVYGMGYEREKGLEHIQYLMKMGFESASYLRDLSERLVSVGKTDSAVSLLEFAVESGNGTREIRELLDGLMVG